MASNERANQNKAPLMPMEFFQVVVAAFLFVASHGCGQQPELPRGGCAHPTEPSPVPSHSAAVDPGGALQARVFQRGESAGRTTARGQGRPGKPAVRVFGGRPIGDVELKVVWTEPTQYDWNYCLRELHGGKDLYHTEYPSETLFLERKLGAKTLVAVSVPDTPYSFYIINGRVSNFFLDSKKSVIWELRGEGLAEQTRQMTSVAASSKRIQFSAGGGDMAAFLVVDFADQVNAPVVTFHVRYDGP